MLLIVVALVIVTTLVILTILVIARWLHILMKGECLSIHLCHTAIPTAKMLFPTRLTIPFM